MCPIIRYVVHNEQTAGDAHKCITQGLSEHFHNNSQLSERGFLF